MIKHDVVANYGGLAYHRARAVVDKETLADLRSGMDLYAAGDEAGKLRNQAWEEGDMGFIKCMRYAVIENVVVDADSRRLSVGSRLITHAENWARDLGATSVELTVYEFNQAAKALYRESGYRPQSVRMSKPL